VLCYLRYIMNRLVAVLTVLLTCSAPRIAHACDCSGPMAPFEELVEADQVFEAEVLYEIPGPHSSMDYVP